MKFVDYNSETIALCLTPPDWAREVKVELNIPTDVAKGISARESRRSFAQSARYTLEYQLDSADAKASTEMRIGLQRLKGETVAVPMWTDQCELSAAKNAGSTVLQKTADMPVRYGAEWILLNDAGTVFEIVVVTAIDATEIHLAAGTAFAWPANTLIFPLLFGRLSERPKFEGITDEILEGTVKFQENSPFARRLNPTAGAIPTVGANITAFSAMKLFAVQPNWDKPIDTTEVDILYRTIGFGRTDARQVYDQPVRRGSEFGFLQGARSDIAAIERFFVDRRGTTRVFMMPTWRGDLRLTQDLPIGGDAQLITVEASEYSDATRPAQPGDPYIALISDTATIDPHKVLTVDEDGLHTQVAVSAAHQYARTIVSHLMLGRFAEAKLSWNYTTDGLASTRLKFIETPDEYATPNSVLPEPVFLYRFTEQLGTPQYWRFTSYENQFVLGSETFVPGPFSHGSIRASTKLDQEKIDLMSFNFSGNPLAKFLPFSLEAALALDILEADELDPGATPRTVFTGEVWDLDPKGDEWKSLCLVFGRNLEKQFPNFFIQKVCNYAIYSPVPRCGVDKNAFKTTGNILSLAGAEIHVGAGNSAAVDYFATGFLETGAAAAFERRTILHSEPITGGIKLILSRPLLKAVVGQALNMFPGCNGAIETCITRFNNLRRFGGHAYVKNTNPSIKAMEAKQVSGGKK
jgi:hypothetical protein